MKGIPEQTQNNPEDDAIKEFMHTNLKIPKETLEKITFHCVHRLSHQNNQIAGVNSLAQSLIANQVITNTLTHLDLSGNVLRGEDLTSFYNFLGHPNSLHSLDLSNTDCSLDLVCSALLRGSVQHLTVLNVSKSVFALRKGKDAPPAFKNFFSSAMVLSSINISGTKLPPEALKALLLGLASNPNVKDVSLDLSCCELRSGGSQILEGCIAEIPNISYLDISDNGLDADMATLLVWLTRNHSIRHLSLGKNFNNIKSKNLTPVLDNLVYMIQEEESHHMYGSSIFNSSHFLFQPLTSLSLADSKLKTDLTIVINALGSNSSLTHVDISGNGMGDMGAKMLAKALQINSKLHTVIWDRNNISPQGLQDVAAALEKNFTIRFMPIPIIDASQALKISPEKTEDALLKIENFLYRNRETRKYVQEQAYRLQQGIVTTTTQKMIDQICVKVQDHLNLLKNTEKNAIQEDVRMAENFLRDAKNSKTLLPNLYHLGVPSREKANTSSVGPIQEKLDSMAGEVTRIMDKQLQMLLESMVDAAESLCPHVMKKSNMRQDLIETGMTKMIVPRSFIKNTLLEQSGIDIMNKISEVKLNLASFLSDRIVDEILEALSSSQQTLAEHLVGKGHPLRQQESYDMDVPEEKIPKYFTIHLVEGERLDYTEVCMSAEVFTSLVCLDTLRPTHPSPHFTSGSQSLTQHLVVPPHIGFYTPQSCVSPSSPQRANMPQTADPIAQGEDVNTWLRGMTESLTPKTCELLLFLIIILILRRLLTHDSSQNTNHEELVKITSSLSYAFTAQLHLSDKHITHLQEELTRAQSRIDKLEVKVQDQLKAPNEREQETMEQVKKLQAALGAAQCDKQQANAAQKDLVTPKSKRKSIHSRMLRPQISSTSSQEGEQNGLMGRVDEGVDEFFSKKVNKIFDKRPSLKSSESQDGDKKRESRKGGFLNLIKSRSSKHDKEKDKDKDKERNQGSAPAQSHIPSTAVSQAASLAEEEPSSPKSTIRSPPLDTKAKFQTPPTNHSSSSERSEEPKTPDSVDSELSEGSPQGSRRYGMQVIGSGLLAEMKVKQEKRGPFCSHKILESTSTSDRSDGLLSDESSDSPTEDPSSLSLVSALRKVPSEKTETTTPTQTSKNSA
ncbi:F-actin-uncapping LRRC16A isoform X1 [Labeo rohita]|uniref:F-actin-uncapping LRRC16A isoform X1 n=1 Tax=Labeo rohita TaxID=84645 RepID=A0A498MDA9_LABRO|nr:F-actin-uncapping LRRC16A isoform X1 [Labeo rohita]